MHHALVDHLKRAGYFKSLCTLQVKDRDARDSVGQRTGGMTNVHENIPCQVGVPRAGMFGKEFNQTSSPVYADQDLVYLDRYIPDIDEKMTAVVDGRVRNISAHGHAINNRFTWFATDKTE